MNIYEQDLAQAALTQTTTLAIVLLFAFLLQRLQVHSHWLLDLRLLDEFAKIANVLGFSIRQFVDGRLPHQHLGDVSRLLGDLGQLQGLLGGSSEDSLVLVVDLAAATKKALQLS